MTAKTTLVFCAQVLFVQSVFSQCSSRGVVADRSIISPIGYGLDVPYGLGVPWGLDGAHGLGACGFGGPAIDFSPTSGGGLPVSSASVVAPVGLAVASVNIYEGIIAATGELPFIGTVGVEGVLPTNGAGAVNHHCGDGINAMVSDKTGYVYSSAYGSGLASAYDLGIITPALGCRSGWAGKSCV